MTENEPSIFHSACIGNSIFNAENHGLGTWLQRVQQPVLPIALLRQRACLGNTSIIEAKPEAFQFARLDQGDVTEEESTVVTVREVNAGPGMISSAAPRASMVNGRMEPVTVTSGLGRGDLRTKHLLYP